MRKFVSLCTILMLFSYIAFSQTREVKGIVKDSNGNPVPFATIFEKGSKNATSANAAGGFSIKIKEGSKLLATAAGFSESIQSAASGVVNFVLNPKIEDLQEVVVTALGVKKSERALGYSVSKLDPDNLLQNSEPDLLKSVQGKVPGVDIRTSQGTPGAATRIQIRGNSSFGLETQPLIIVDGVPYSNSQVTTSSQTDGGAAYGSGIGNLDPNDIESFNILKGAAAAALYGSRASRGVLIITTKSGSAKKGTKPVNINFKSSYSFENIANLPDYQNTYGAGSNFKYANSNGSWGAKFGTLDSIAAWGEYLTAYPELFSSTGKTPFKAYPNNVKELFRTGQVIENSIGFNAGTGNTTFALTASNLVHSGYVENSKYSRNSLGIGGQTKYNNLTIGANLSYTKSNQRGGFFGENQVEGAASQFARTMFLARNWDLSLPYQDATGKPLTPNGGGQFDNPHWSAYNNISTTGEQRVTLGARLGYKINSWIDVVYNFGLNQYSLDRTERIQEKSRAADGLGRIVSDNYNTEEMESTLMVMLSPKLINNFSFDFKIGNNINQRKSDRAGFTGLDFIVSGIYNLQNTATQSFDLTNVSKRRIVGFFGEAQIGYKNFAYLTLSGRNDITSTLPYKNASYFYPAISGSFIFTEALGIRSDFLNFGKLRLAWAKVGNDASPHNGQDVYDLGLNFLGQPRTGRSTLTTDPNLTPEFTKEIEAGIDLALLNKKINLDFTYYNKSSTNLIYAIEIPVTTGYDQFYTNIGEISNKGVEIGLTLKPVQSPNFSWEIRGAFTKNENLVVSLTEGLERASLSGVLDELAPYLEAGKPFGYLRGTKVDRDKDGTVLINPETGGMIVSLEHGMIGNPNPDYKLGISTALNYKGLTLSGLFDITKGGDMYSVTVTSLLGRGVIEDTKDRETSWVIPGIYGDPNSHLPILSGGKTISNQTRITTNDLFFSPNPDNGATFAINTATEFNIYDATVYRLREINLGYNIPKKWISKLNIDAANISLSGRNLWYLAPNVPKSTNFDPEVNSFGATNVQGIELSAAPNMKRYGINLSITL